MWPSPLDIKLCRYFPLAILHLCMKYDSCTLNTTQVIVSEPKCWQSSDVTFTFGPKKCIGIFFSPSCIYVWTLYVENYSSYRVRKSLDKVQSRLRPFDPKMYRYFPLTIVNLCMIYESCTLKTTQVIVSEPKCWQSSVVTLTYDLLASKCICVFLSPSCIYAWYMKSQRWILLKISCQNQC